jgi:hypothetical protein
MKRTQKTNWACFVVFSLSICDIMMSSSANRSADWLGDECSNLKMLPVHDLSGATGETRALDDPAPSPYPRAVLIVIGPCSSGNYQRFG